MHAAAAEALLFYLKPGAKVLDVGSGSGYLTHVLAELVQPGGKVVGIDHIQPLVDMGSSNTQKSQQGKDLMRSGGIKYIKGDGREGWAEDAPYDAIHVGAAAAGFHQKLIDQLKAPGRFVRLSVLTVNVMLMWCRLFMPVEENELQHIYVIDKAADGSVTKKRDIGVRYVPLTDAPDE